MLCARCEVVQFDVVSILFDIYFVVKIPIIVVNLLSVQQQYVCLGCRGYACNGLCVCVL